MKQNHPGAWQPPQLALGPDPFPFPLQAARALASGTRPGRGALTGRRQAGSGEQAAPLRAQPGTWERPEGQGRRGRGHCGTAPVHWPVAALQVRGCLPTAGQDLPVPGRADLSHTSTGTIWVALRLRESGVAPFCAGPSPGLDLRGAHGQSPWHSRFKDPHIPVTAALCQLPSGLSGQGHIHQQAVAGGTSTGRGARILTGPGRMA